MMKRREFLKSSALMAGFLQSAAGSASGAVRAHNWDHYDFGSGPEVKDRLNQGPFPQYAPDAAIPSDEVVMTTTPAEEAVPNFGRGLTHMARGSSEKGTAGLARLREAGF